MTGNKKRESEERNMKAETKRKCMAAMAVVSFMSVLVTGCSNGEEKDQGVVPFSENEAVTGQTDKEQLGEDGSVADASEEGISGEGAGSSDENLTITDQEENRAGENQAENKSPEKTVIGGKVRSIDRNSFVLSLTIWEDSEDGAGSSVLIPEPGSPEEVLVTVQCADSVVYELWTIQGGGAGIQKEEASFSEIQEGIGLEAEGYYEGNEFVADKVIIEIYE